MVLMISQPMKGKTQEQINEERNALIKDLTSKGHVVTDTVFAEQPPETDNVAIWYLAKSINAMSGVDGVIFMKGWENARGCRIEHDVAVAYGLFVKEL